MSKGNKTPAKSNKLKLAQNLKERRAHKDVKKIIEHRNYRGRVL